MVDPTLAELERSLTSKPVTKQATAPIKPPPANPVKLAKDWRDHVQTCMQCRDPANPCPWGKEVQAQIPEPLWKEFEAILKHEPIKKILLNPNQSPK